MVPKAVSNSQTSSLNTQQNVAVESGYNLLLLWKFLLYKSYLSSWNQATTLFPLWNKTELAVLCNAKLLCFSKTWQPTQDDSIKCPFPEQEISKLFIEPEPSLFYYIPNLKTSFSFTPTRKASVENMILKSLPQSLTSKYYQALSYISA